MIVKGACHECGEYNDIEIAWWERLLDEDFILFIRSCNKCKKAKTIQLQEQIKEEQQRWRVLRDIYLNLKESENAKKFKHT